jgi:hypothetical protein
MSSKTAGRIMALVLWCLASCIAPSLAAGVTADSPPSAGAKAADAQAKPPQPPLNTSGIQSQALLSAIGDILKRAAEHRQSAKTLPERDQFLFPPLWTETREDREHAIRKLLDSALDIVTDAPILQLQEEISKQRGKIAAARDRIASLREKRLDAPESAFMPGIVTDTRDTITAKIAALEKDIKTREADIARIKQDIGNALSAAGMELSKEKLDLLLDSVLGSHLLKLVTAFEVSKIADQKLAALLNQSKNDLKAARRYFAMHAALFAMLVEAQGLLIEQIDTVYLVRLGKIVADISKTNAETRRLLQSHARDDQRRVLEANLKAQEESQKVAAFYKAYLRNQRRLLAEARSRTVFDLRVADNTFETVEESFQLKVLMEDAKPSFDALHRMEAPGFEQIFRNENLKREFENLTQKLAPSS